MHVLVVDDEAPARERLKRLLAQIDDVEIIGEAENGIQAIEMIEQELPDLVLLDIQMPGLDGFGVIEALEQPPPIVFVTAYDEHAIRAFEVNALDYLLKPASRERLEKAICRAREAKAEARDFAAPLAPLLEHLTTQGHYLTRLAVRDRNHIRVLDINEVDWIGVEEEQVFIHTGTQAYPIHRTLKELENRLDPTQFFRTHRSAIVNLDRVQEIIPWFKGTHKLRLTTGAEVELSRARTRILRKVLEW
jgi:two-component system LytT family response regulator